jgi:hypothetical protein
MRLLTFLIVTLLFIQHSVVAQTGNGANDRFRGVWEYGKAGETDKVHAKLHIAGVQDHILYPAKLTLSVNEYTSTCYLLLAKKSIRQLAIGSQRNMIEETPFTSGASMHQFNGVFDLSADRNGGGFLTINRLRYSQVKLRNQKKDKPDARHATTATLLFNFLENDAVRFTKTSDSAWDEPAVFDILHSPYSGFYYGKRDTFGVRSLTGVTKFSGKHTGIVSASVNGRTIFDHAYARDKRIVNEIKLDTGANLIALFVEEYGKKPAQTVQMDLDFYTHQTALHFADKKDDRATFILLPVTYFGPIDTASPKLNNLKLMMEQMVQNRETIYYYPDTDGQQVSVNEDVQRKLLREATVVGNMTATSREVLLGLWDDAVEDGDSISLNINGTWVVQGMPVLKRPQFISVKLNAGVNKIIFIADNQGSIIPNTSMLEIIDERQRKSYKINTDYFQNNLINILYELPPGKGSP